MNERIKKLAKRSCLIQYDSDGKMQDAIRFAEMIIQECLVILEPDIFDEEIEYHFEQRFYKRYREKLLKHFNVSRTNLV